MCVFSAYYVIYQRTYIYIGYIMSYIYLNEYIFCLKKNALGTNIELDEVHFYFFMKF